MNSIGDTKTKEDKLNREVMNTNIMTVLRLLVTNQ